MEAAFEASKAAMYNAAELAHPLEGAELSLATDASETHVGAVLQQKTEAGIRPLAFFSSKLNSAAIEYRLIYLHFITQISLFRCWRIFRSTTRPHNLILRRTDNYDA